MQCNSHKSCTYLHCYYLHICWSISKSQVVPGTQLLLSIAWSCSELHQLSQSLVGAWQALPVSPWNSSSYFDFECFLRFEVFWRRRFPPREKCCKNGGRGTPHRWRQVFYHFFRINPKSRLPWLKTLASLLLEHPDCILACSALKQNYRELLRSDLTSAEVAFIYLRSKFNLQSVSTSVCFFFKDLSCFSFIFLLNNMEEKCYKHGTITFSISKWGFCQLMTKTSLSSQGLPDNYCKKAEEETRSLFQGVTYLQSLSPGSWVKTTLCSGISSGQPVWGFGGATWWGGGGAGGGHPLWGGGGGGFQCGSRTISSCLWADQMNWRCGKEL